MHTGPGGTRRLRPAVPPLGGRGDAVLDALVVPQALALLARERAEQYRDA